MMKRLPYFTSLRRLLVPCLLGCTLAHAQTAIWRGPVATSTNSLADWSADGNWDTGTVPNGRTATVVIQDGILGDTASPLRVGLGLDRPSLLELAGIRYDSAGGNDEARVFPIMRLAESSGSQTLRLVGTGIAVPNRAPNAPRLWLGSGTALEFTGTATISGSPPASDKTGTGHAVRITAENGSTLRFRDQSTAGSGALFIHPGARLEFSGTGSGGRALILAGGGHNRLTPDQLPPPDPDAPDSLITFRNEASLEFALIRTDGRVEFHDTATAGRGYIESTGETWFFGQSTVGQAVVRGKGSLIFMDQSSAGAGLIYSPSLIEFRRLSTAGTAMIWADTLRFSDSANAGSAWIVGANRLEVLDQADLSKSTLPPRISDSIRVQVLDISGARTVGGSSPRIAAGQGAAAGTVMADNAREVGVRSLWSLGTDSRVHLGSSTLVLEGYATIQGRITDAGGAYRDEVNRDFTGGGLIIRGIVEISNPDNLYSGPTLLQSGSLYLRGGAVSATAISQGALLHGTGTIRGHLVNNGTVNTDIYTASFGRTLQVQGDYHQGITGNLQMRMTPTTRDTLAVTGNASLAGGILHFFGGDAFGQSETINFFTAASRTGQWAAINLPGVAAGFAARVAYTATGAQLVIEQGQVSSLHGMSAAPAEQLVVLTPMGYRAGREVGTLFGVGGAAPAETLVQAIAAHDPSAYSLLPAGSLLSALSRQQGVERQSAELRDTLPEHVLVLTSEINQREESLDAATAPSARTRAGGFLASAFWRADGFVLSGTLAGESVRSHPVSGGVFDLDRLSPGLALRYGRDGTFVTLAAAYTHEDYDLSRPIVFPGTSLAARATPRAGRFDASLLAGHAFARPGWTVTPTAGLLVSQWNLSDFTEEGVPDGAATLQNWRSRALLVRAGLELKARLREGRLVPRLHLNWLRTVDASRDLAVRYAGATDGFNLPGIAPDRELLQAGFACDWRINDGFQAGFSVGGTHGNRTRVISEVSAGLRYSF